MIRNPLLAAFAAFLSAQVAFAGSIPERTTVEVLGKPEATWFINVSSNGSYVFDAASGDMLGMLSVSSFTPALAVSLQRREAYAAESYLSRGSTGSREDIFSIYSTETLSGVAEIDVPDKIAEVAMAALIGLLNDDKFVAYYNMTPAQSVGIIDLDSRQHVTEISTAGCAMILPVGERSFLMLCGDGSAQLIDLAADGTESNRTRTKPFFSVQDDAIFDSAARLSDGWFLISHQGHAYTIGADNGEIVVSDPWLMGSEGDKQAGWRPGGFSLVTANRAAGVAYVLMHQGEVDTHHAPASEVWVINVADQKRIARWTLDVPSYHVLALQGQSGLVVTETEESTFVIHDAATGEEIRVIDEIGRNTLVLQEFGLHD